MALNLSCFHFGRNNFLYFFFLQKLGNFEFITMTCLLFEIVERLCLVLWDFATTSKNARFFKNCECYFLLVIPKSFCLIWMKHFSFVFQFWETLVSTFLTLNGVWWLFVLKGAEFCLNLAFSLKTYKFEHN